MAVKINDSPVQRRSSDRCAGSQPDWHSAKGAHPVKPSTRDEIKSKFHNLKGKVKEKAGQLTSDPDLEAEGQAEMKAGRTQRKIGQVKRFLGK